MIEFAKVIAAAIAIDVFLLAGVAYIATRPRLTPIERWMRDNPPKPESLETILDKYEKAHR